MVWRDVPASAIGCSGVTCRRRLRDWTEAGVWPRLRALLSAELRAAGLLDPEVAAIGGSHVRALKGGTLAWMMTYRRLARDYERQPPISEAMIRWAVINMLARRLTEVLPLIDLDHAHSNERAEPNDHYSNTPSVVASLLRNLTFFRPASSVGEGGDRCPGTE